jgi:membrane-associated protease RseP (regulator of RpoE activity)
MNVLRLGPIALGLFAMFLAFPSTARADEEKAKVEAKGKWILISPDGKKIELDLGEAGKKVILPLRGVPGVNWAPKVVGRKTIVIGPGGKKIEVEPGKAGPVPPFRVQVPPVHLTQLKGKMIFVGPDGKTREIDLSKFSGAKTGTYRLFALPRTANFMLGLDCEPADAVLRSHLGLDKGVGLVVKSALKGTPANKAGLRQYDVLVRAGKTPLSSTADLVKAVQEAGKEGKSVKLEIIRAGKKSSVEVTPAKRKPVKIEVEGKKGVGGGYSFGGFYGPRTAPRAGADQLEKRVEELSKKVEKLEKAIEKLKKDD